MTTLKKVITEESNYNPKLSVIVPVYKVEKYLVRCIDSILAQTFVDFELLLIDDGSPDKSGDICDEYACKDTRIRVFHKENGGVSSARNLGLENVRGNILTFIDADDWIDVDCFENGVCIMDRDDLDILQYSYKMIREQDGCVISVRNYECVPLGWREFVRTDHYIVCVGGNFIRSSIVKTYRLRFDEALHLAEGQLFIMRVMSLSTRIAQTKEIYYNYFQNLASATHNSCEEDMVKSSRALLEFGKRNRLFKPQVDRMITNFYVELLLLNNGQAGILDSVYREAKVEIRNLNMNSLRILCFSSFLGMRMAGKIVLAYLKIKKFCMLS